MAVDVMVERTINRPPDEVAAYAMDPAHDSEWIGGVVEANPLGDGATGVGARVARVAKFLGRRIEYINEVVEHSPPNRLVMQSVEGPFPMKITYVFEPHGDAATRASLRVQGDASRFFRLASPLLAVMVRRSLRRDLATLDKRLASDPD